jgi:hypothetical protein
MRVKPAGDIAGVEHGDIVVAEQRTDDLADDRLTDTLPAAQNERVPHFSPGSCNRSASQPITQRKPSL